MKYLNTILTRGLNLIKSWLRPGFILLSILFTIGVGQIWAWYVPGTINGTYWGTTDNNMGSDNSITFYAVAGGTYQFQLTNGSNWGGNGCIQSVSGVTKGTNGSNATITFSGTKDITITVVDETNWKVSVTASDPTYHIKYNWYSSGWSWVELSPNGDGTYSCNGLYRANTKAFNYIKRSSDSDDGMNYKDGTSGVTLTNSPSGGDNCVFTFNPSGATLNILRCNKVTKTNYIYFDNSGNNLPNTNKYFVIGHDKPTKYSKVYNSVYSTNIPHTKLAYWKNTADSWTDATYYGFVSPASDWGNGDWGSDNLSNGGKYTAAFTAKRDLANGKYYLFDTNGNANNGATLYVSEKSSYSNLNTNQYAVRIVLAKGATNFARSSSNSIGSVSIEGYYLSAAGGCSSNSADVGANESNSVQAAYTGELTYTASPGSGYVFAGWYNLEPTTLGSQTPVSTDLTYTCDAPINANWMFAGFIEDTPHDVTIRYRCTSPAKSIQADAVRAVGELMTSSISAPEIPGYTFSSWEVGSGIDYSTSSLTANPIVVKAKASGAYVITAKYTEDLSSTYVLKGAFDSWGSGIAMSKKTGHSDEDWVYATRSFTGSTTKTAIKIYDGSSNWYGKASTNITKTLGSLTKSVTGLSSGGGEEKNMYLEHLVTGTYEIGYNISTHELVVTWPDVNQIQITSGDASSPTPAGYYNFDGVSGTVYSKTFTFSKNKRYSAKIIYHSDFYTFNNTSDMTISDHTDWRLYNNVADKICNVYAPVAGTYTYQFNSNNSGNTTLTVVFPTAYTITFGAGDINGSNSTISVTASPTFTSGQYVLATTAVTFNKGTTKAGYTWKGWYSNADGTGTLYSSTDGSWTSAASTRTGNISVYACYTLKTYTATLSTIGKTGYGSGAPANQTVTYTQAMPTITPPTAANGYCFMGYWDGTEGTGTQYYKADGTSARTWNKTSNATLHAYFKKAEITDLEIDPSLVEKGGTVEVNPVIEPTPAGTTSVCYYLLYMNGNKVDPQPDFGNPNSPDPDIKVSFTAPSIAGTYILAAALRTGSTCGGGTLLDSVATHTFQVGGEYNVTIKYMCGTTVIKEQTKQGANPVEYTSISAPDIFGYTFSTWKLGDGITKHTSDALTKKDGFRFTASYDGTITAIYTKNQYIYLDLSQQFSESGYWNNPYVYFYSANPWNDTYGVGATGHSNYISGHAMTQIGTSKIWYYDYSGVSGACNYVAFTWGNKTGQDNFNYTDVIFRGDFTDGTPLFVPSTGQSKVTKNNAAYYSQGYWVKYLGEETGYRLIIYDAGGTVELKRIGFTSDDKRMTMKAVTDLEAEHTYYYEVYRDDGYYYKNNTSNITPTSRGPKNLKDGTKGTIKTSAAGDYTFTLGYTYSNGYFTISVDYPAVVGDYQFLYGDQASADYWSTGSAHSSTWRHPSRIISKTAGAKDTISFFVVKGASPTLEYRTVNSIAANGTITWNAKTAISGVVDTISKTGVYNFILHQSSPAGSISIEKVEPYTGDFYIRTDAVSNKWDNYTTDPDHLMTYSAFSEDRSQNGFGELFSHYKAKWCPRGTNVKFVIANDYSPCISDTLIRDVSKSWPENMDVYGTLNSDGSADVTKDRWSANIRFMWNRSTNKISRAYVAASTNVTRKFLVLRGCDAKIHDHNNNAIPATTYLAANEVLLEDDQNWIYETTIKAQPEARVKLYACYGREKANEQYAQYFRGAYDSGNCGSSTNSIQILGGTGESYYLMRVIYDFKTNRLITAWLPDGTAVDQAPLNIDADVMVIRDHQQGAEAITFTTNTKSLGQVKTVYGTMRFNRWTLSNRYRSSDTGNPSFVPSTTETDINKDHCKDGDAISRYHAPLPPSLQTSSFERNNYFISFPFDVQLSEVFGFGTYGTHWIISKYNGLRRAQVGYFRDNCINGDFDCTNWDYIWDPTGVTLNAYEGYLLSLDLDLMQYDDTTNFWLNQIHQVELYFPSKVPMSTITTTNVTLPGMTDDYLCTKNYNKDGTNPEGDRRVKDSYWRCIGVPSYAPYGTVLKTGETEIQWNTDYTWYEDQRSFPFLYEWNTTDNTLTPQRTKTFNFKPLHSYLVQNKNTITWTAVSATPSSVVARRRQLAEELHEYSWRLALNGAEEDESDTYIRMTDDEDVTEGFDFGPDMIKKFRDGYIVDANGDPIWDSSIDDYKQGVLHSDIYSVLGYEYLAANSLPMNTTSTTIVPIGVRLKKTGEYTISMPDGTYGVSITLVDNLTGARTELGAGFTYSFESEAGQFDERFHLEIAKIQNVATGTEEIGESSKSDVRKVIINGILYIVRGNRIYDARGTRVE